MNKGFTLVEVMITIGVASILMLGTMQISELSMKSAQSVARKTAVDSELNRIFLAMKKQIGSSNDCSTYIRPNGSSSGVLTVTAGNSNPIDLYDSSNNRILTNTLTQFPGTKETGFTHKAYIKMSSTGVPNTYVAEIYDQVNFPSKTYGSKVVDKLIGTVSMTLDNSYKITGKCTDLSTDYINLGAPSSTSSNDPILRKNSNNELYWDNPANLLPVGTLCGTSHVGSGGGTYDWAVGSGCMGGSLPKYGCPAGFSQSWVCDDNGDSCGTAMVFCKKN